MNVTEPIVKAQRHRQVGRRIAAAGVALAAVLTLGACKATGGGTINLPVPSGTLPAGDITGAYTGQANFGFNFTCEMKGKKKAVIKGGITYHDTGTSAVGGRSFNPIRIIGVVDPVSITAPDCAAAAEIFLDAAQFSGTYRSQDTSLSSTVPGRFNVLVFDQGEPGRSSDPAFITGDGFAIDLVGGPYALYTRAGYIEGGNIQVS